jgi:site-specific recombinase XerD
MVNALGASISKRFHPDLQTQACCRDAFSVEQISELFNSIDCSTLLGKRDFALLNILARTGLRTIEVTRADVGDIRQVGGVTEKLINWTLRGHQTKDWSKRDISR